MTPEAMRYFINQLAATSHEQGRTKNFGVAAKVAAGSRNPEGLEYRCWQDGHGALVRFGRHRDGRWGLCDRVDDRHERPASVRAPTPSASSGAGRARPRARSAGARARRLSGRGPAVE